MASEQMIVKSIRMPVRLDNLIAEIARYEDRTVSKVIQRLLWQGVNKYNRENPDMRAELSATDKALFEDEMFSKGYEIKRRYSVIPNNDEDSDN